MELNKYIDHTLLRANVTKEEITKLCEEAKDYNFASVCVNPYYVSLCRQLLAGSNVKVCTVIGFPLGQNSKAVKAFEASQAIQGGAQEVDMVLNISELKNNNLNYVTEEIKQLVNVCHKHNVILKVIIETCLLNQEQKINACKCVNDAKADFIKTSTGFSISGATIDDVKLLRQNCPESIKVKASGGIRCKQDAINMIEAGADRLGTSSGVKIIKE